MLHVTNTQESSVYKDQILELIEQGIPLSFRQQGGIFTPKIKKRIFRENFGRVSLVDNSRKIKNREIENPRKLKSRATGAMGMTTGRRLEKNKAAGPAES
ncbi:unnamed protein product [Musa acuminata var. zebrina]